MKDKLTSSTHTEREQRRLQREEAERRSYAQHRALRLAMSKAAETGHPQLVGRDRDGRDVYIEPPAGPPPGYYGGNSYGFNPFMQGPYMGGMYGGNRYMRPGMAYGRPYGGGFGGGYGLPLAAGLGGGMLLGGLMF